MTMIKFLLLTTTIFFLSTFIMAQGAAPGAGDQSASTGKYALNAFLVVTPEQCKLEHKKRGEKFKVGEPVCSAAEETAKQAFQQFTRVETVPEKGTDPNKIILTFKFVDLDATTTITAFGKRKMVMLLEWTATDSAGKVFWVQTVEGTTEEPAGNIFTYKKHKTKMIDEAKTDLIAKSVKAMRESPEFQKIAQKATVGSNVSQ